MKILLFLTALAASTQAAVTYPFGTAEGSVGNSSYLSTFEGTMQALYDSSLLTDIPVGAQITGIAFRLDTAGTAPTSTIAFPNFELTLSSSTVAVEDYEVSLWSYVDTSDDVIVRSGPLSFAPSSYQTTTDPRPFTARIDFTTPYTYTGNDLLITLRHDSAPGNQFPFLDHVPISSTAAGSRLPYYDTDQYPLGFELSVPVIEITYTVPEPSVALSSLAGLGLLMLRRRR